MKKQLELDGIPRKRVSLITEPAGAPKKEEPVVDAYLDGIMKRGSIYTEWFPMTINPPRAGFWEVRPPGTTEPDRKVWFDRQGWHWPFLDSRAFAWRGLQAPAPGGYIYYVEGAKRSRIALRQ